MIIGVLVKFKCLINIYFCFKKLKVKHNSDIKLFMNKLSNDEILNKKEALELFKKHSFKKSYRLLNQIILEDKVKDPMSFFLLGTSYLHERDLDLAEKNLKISIDQNKNYYNSHHNLGVTLQLQ